MRVLFSRERLVRFFSINALKDFEYVDVKEKPRGARVAGFESSSLVTNDDVVAVLKLFPKAVTRHIKKVVYVHVKVPWALEGMAEMPDNHGKETGRWVAYVGGLGCGIFPEVSFSRRLSVTVLGGYYIYVFRHYFRNGEYSGEYGVSSQRQGIERTVGHEVGHLVYNEFLTDGKKKAWSTISSRRYSVFSDIEEKFCDAFGLYALAPKRLTLRERMFFWRLFAALKFLGRRGRMEFTWRA